MGIRWAMIEELGGSVCPLEEYRTPNPIGCEKGGQRCCAVKCQIRGGRCLYELDGSSSDALVDVSLDCVM